MELEQEPGLMVNIMDMETGILMIILLEILMELEQERAQSSWRIRYSCQEFGAT